MITLTFVRHGESTDNLRPFWAGWADAPLSNHGLNQARAAGKYFADYSIAHIFASDLKRAHSTARAIFDAQPEPKPSFTVTKLIREQHFGEGEGKPFTSRPGEGDWSIITDRDGKFAGGESLNDVARRGDQFYEEHLESIIRQSVHKPPGEVNVFVVSHGIAIGETLGALARRCVHVDNNGTSGRFKGLHNTAWTRVTIGLEDESFSGIRSTNGTPNPSVTPDPGAVMATKVQESAPPPTQCEEAGPPSIRMKVLACNQHSHLQGVVRQEDGNRSSGDDPAQRKLKEFFGGGGSD